MKYLTTINKKNIAKGTNMNNEIKDLLPQWYNDEHDLVLSNDIDSLASCAVLKKAKGWDIKYFYDFKNVYRIYKYESEKEKCWVDVAIKEGHAFDNHVSKLTLLDDWNEEMINLNEVAWITNECYEDKYAGSTLLEVWSLYDLPLPKTEEGKMLLLAIDVSFKGFYTDKFHDTQKHYLVNMLGFDELYDVIKRHNRGDFYDIIAKYGLNADIVCKNGHLKSNLRLKEIGKLLELDLELPEGMFEIIEELDVVEEDVEDYHNCLNDVSLRIKTIAFTYKNKMRYSKVHVERSENIMDIINFLKGRKRECTCAEE